MKKARFTTEQIIAVLQEHAAGATPADVMRRQEISRQTFYHWKKQFGDMPVRDARSVRTVEDENRRLKRLVADQALNLQILKDVLV